PIKSQSGPTSFLVAGDKLPADGHSNDANVAGVQTRCGLGEGEVSARHEIGEPSIGTTRHRVGLVEQYASSQATGCEGRRRARETAHRKQHAGRCWNER